MRIGADRLHQQKQNSPQFGVLLWHFDKSVISARAGRTIHAHADAIIPSERQHLSGFKIGNAFHLLIKRGDYNNFIDNVVATHTQIPTTDLSLPKIIEEIERMAKFHLAKMTVRKNFAQGLRQVTKLTGVHIDSFVRPTNTPEPIKLPIEKLKTIINTVAPFKDEFFLDIGIEDFKKTLAIKKLLIEDGKILPVSKDSAQEGKVINLADEIDIEDIQKYLRTNYEVDTEHN